MNVESTTPTTPPERTSFLLGDEALARLARLAQLMGLSKSKALEQLLLGLTIETRPKEPSK